MCAIIRFYSGLHRRLYFEQVEEHDFYVNGRRLLKSQKQKELSCILVQLYSNLVCIILPAFVAMRYHDERVTIFSSFLKISLQSLLSLFASLVFQQ
ncbi:unnamed protein product [Prunus brigantina]